jgi:hypothetical protein
MLLAMIYVLCIYIGTSWSICKVFVILLMSCFPGMLFKYFMNVV